mgnify:CR=1 FL=1|jgi:large subunit ribosomal protein L31e|tara:strand:- start:1164 stop:1652 length:489 start_codon:yes stop_codon:yes gene_type:complete
MADKDLKKEEKVVDNVQTSKSDTGQVLKPEKSIKLQEKPTLEKKEETEKPKKESIMKQVKKMAEAKKAGKPLTKKDPKTEVKKGPARVFTVPLKVGTPRNTKTRRAIHYLRAFVLKHTKQEAVIDQELNEFLWERGRKKAPARIRVSVETTEDGKSLVSLKK